MKAYKKALFIYNPLSGNRDIATELDKIIEHFIKNKIILTVIRLEEEIYDILSELLNTLDYDFIIGVGGDGTIDSIARRIVKNNITKPYAVIGSGTCNNFASNISMPSGVYKTIEEIAKYKTAMVDIGCLQTGQIFLSSLAIGVFAETSFETNSDLKEWLGPFAYHLQGLTQLPNIKTNKFIIKSDKKTVELQAYMVLVLNGTNVGNIGGLFGNNVDIKDGLFEMIIVKEANPVDLANLLVKVVKGEDFTNSNIIEIIKSSEFEIDCEDRSLAVSIDGEKGPSLPLKLSVKPNYINVIVGNTYEE
ncbi:YegS//BmrU family lipid kinase [Peptoanaerobacter stomatis]|uniref:Putative lipid kinase n=1 Tax=Peptoanaerobacter stomatis TaxID=796937 RepID=J6HF73_9FIRM|nr:YegS/Rv2252/BmrU family lipid kinase [Peptoanaerobacter stomatis]EHL15281.1 YegS//BmrU family lipid kinase [Peptoanaerobacter stomatis]EJU23635.1 putative lipid kinase [Peptoanaerobacter stomatis]NWO24596.1 YegS/Rv2252/BmrU family lipid kinase [Peptostreptococcaceae bacterium oral taxon 081]